MALQILGIQVGPYCLSLVTVCFCFTSDHLLDLNTCSYPLSLIDGTTKRFKDNSKLVVVEGPPALDKTKFAKGCLLFSLLRGRVGVILGSKSRKWVNFPSSELAEEFGMLYVPGFTMDDFYINAYGYDLRELDFVFKYTRNKCFDEKLFAQDPTANDHGLDRMLYTSHVKRFVKPPWPTIFFTFSHTS